MQAATMPAMVNVMQAAALQFELGLLSCRMCCSICNPCHKKGCIQKQCLLQEGRADLGKWLLPMLLGKFCSFCREGFSTA